MARLIALVAFVVCVATSCGPDSAAVHSVSAEQASLAVSDVCRPEYLTLATAIEAYVASTGVLPASEGELVAAGLMRDEIEHFDALIATDDYEIVSVSDRCAGFDPSVPAEAAESGPSADQSDCTVELKTMQVAWEAYNADRGTPPATEADLVPEYLRVELVGFDIVGTEIVPAPGVCG